MTTKIRLGAGAWLDCLQFFVAEQLARLGWRGHYSLRGNYISDLGATSCTAGVCSHWHGLMNASFLLQGALIAAGALLLRGLPAPGWPGRIARGLLLLAALGVAVVGWAPENVDLNLHIYGAQLNFEAGTLGMLCWALAQFRHSRRPPGSPVRGGSLMKTDKADPPSPRTMRRIAWAALLAGLVAALGDALLALGSGPEQGLLGPGTIERLAAYPLPLWLAWTGWQLLRGGKRGGDL